ncbi:MAG: prolyl oligopeptidase family serine peptidase [Clostridia bacterium]|nr:prolyl oligopeptidase family serine peptidase [Clostridia bacterium]
MKKFSKIAAFILSALMALSMAGCQSGPGNSDSSSVPCDTLSSAPEKDSFNFADYLGEDIIEISKVENGEQLDAKCATYRFIFLSDKVNQYKIKGFISIPVSCMETRTPCKCLVYCRGGNSELGEFKKDDTAMRSAFTNRIVIGCEHRGGNGTEGTDEFGGDDLNDVIRLIDFCDTMFEFADMDDLCVEGESRGGLMAYMTARRDNRVKKIIVCSGISDLFAAFDERQDKMPEVLIRCIGGTPQELPEEYEKRSAVCWADEIKIPVLIFHSKGDKQANFETQAQTIYDKLKDSTDCTFITHDDDLHGFHNEDIPIMADWIEHH